MKAFPNTTVKATEPPGTHKKTLDPGMDLRDYFAARAMQVLMHDTLTKEQGNQESDIALSYQSYRMADAMIEARGR